MKKFKNLAFILACTFGFSFNSFSQIPPDGNCSAWQRMYNHCLSSPTGIVGGMTCADIDRGWYECLYG